MGVFFLEKYGVRRGNVGRRKGYSYDDEII